MKIVLMGNHNPHFFNSVQCRERAFRELGHEVVFFNSVAYKLPGRVREAVPVLERWDRERNCRELVALCEKERPRMCLVIGGLVTPSALRAIGRMGITTVFWTTDPPTDTSYIQEPAPFVDWVFCSGSEAMPLVSAAKPRREPYWLPFACDAELHAPAALTEADRLRYARDMAFVGSFYANRQDFFEALCDFDLGIWGPGWRKAGKRSPLWPVIDDRRVNYNEWSKIFAAAGITLVVHYQDGKTPCYQASPKLFEAMACGAFVMCDDQKDARAIFKDGEHLIFFNSVEDLKDKARYYLDRPDERRRIAARGREEVVSRHTYRHRVEELLRKVFPHE